MVTSSAQERLEVKKYRGSELRNKWAKATASDCTPLTFGDLTKGDKFISMPLPGDNNGHDGLLVRHFVFVKTDQICHPQTPQNAVRLSDGHSDYFKDHLEVILVK